MPRRIIIIDALLLLLLLLRHTSADWDGSNGCPGYKIDNHYYVTDRKDIRFCSYSIKGSPPFPPYQKKLTSYTCTDRKRKVKCSGTILNENYAFWDNVVHDFVKEIPQCPYSVPGCQDLDQVCVDDTPRSCSGDGKYICQALDPVVWNGERDDSPNRTIAQPDEGWCRGIIDSPERYNCPPRHVASFAEVTKFCQQPTRVNETHYKCVSHGRTVCQGTIEPAIVSVPQCSMTAEDCSKAQRKQVCQSMLSTREQQFCGAKYIFHQDSMTWKYFGNVLECADRKHDGKWCRTELNATLTATYRKDEYCPKASLNSCYELSQIFIRPAFCFCIQNHTTGEEVEFRCHHDGQEEPWCVGHVEAPKFDKYKKLLPKKYPGNAIEETRNYRSSLDKEDNSCSGTGCKAGISIAFIVTSVILLTLIVRRMRRRKRKAGDHIVYDRVFRGTHELELQSSTYRDRPNTIII